MSLILSACGQCSQSAGLYIVNNSASPFITFIGFNENGNIITVAQPDEGTGNCMPSATSLPNYPIEFISNTADQHGNCLVVINNNIYNIAVNMGQINRENYYICFSALNFPNYQQDYISAPSGLTSVYFPWTTAFPFYYVANNTNDIMIYNSNGSSNFQTINNCSSIISISGKMVPDVDNNNNQPVNIYGYGTNNGTTCIFVIPDITSPNSYYIADQYMSTNPSINSITFTANYETTTEGVLYYVYDLSNQIIAYNTSSNMYNVIYTHTNPISYLDWNYYNNVSTNTINYVLAFLDNMGTVYQYDISLNYLTIITTGLDPSGAIMWPIDYSYNGYGLVCADISSSYVINGNDSGTVTGLYCELLSPINPYVASVCKLAPVYDPNTNLFNVYSLMFNSSVYGIDLNLNIYDQSGNPTGTSITVQNSNPLWSINIDPGSPYDVYVSDLYNTYHYTYSTTNAQLTLVQTVDFSSVCATACAATPWTINSSYVYNGIIYYLDWFSSLYQYNYSTSLCSCDDTWDLIIMNGRYGVRYGINESDNLVVNGITFSSVSIPNLQLITLINDNQFSYIQNLSNYSNIIYSPVNISNSPNNPSFSCNYYNGRIISFDSVLINNVAYGILLDELGNIYQYVISEPSFYFNQPIPIAVNNSNLSVYGYLTCIPYSLRTCYTDGINTLFYSLYPLSAKPIVYISMLDSNNILSICILLNGIVSIQTYQYNGSTLSNQNDISIAGNFQGYVTSIYSNTNYTFYAVANENIYQITWNATQLLGVTQIGSLTLPPAVSYPTILWTTIIDISNDNIQAIYSILNNTEIFDQSGNSLLQLPNVPSWVDCKNGFIYGYYLDNSNLSHIFCENNIIPGTYKTIPSPYYFAFIDRCTIIFVNPDNTTQILAYNFGGNYQYLFYTASYGIWSLDSVIIDPTFSIVVFLDVNGDIWLLQEYNNNLINIASGLSYGIIYCILPYITNNNYIAYIDCSQNVQLFNNPIYYNYATSASYDSVAKYYAVYSNMNNNLTLNLYDSDSLVDPLKQFTINGEDIAISVQSISNYQSYYCSSNYIYDVSWNNYNLTSNPINWGNLDVSSYPISMPVMKNSYITHSYIDILNNIIYYACVDSCSNNILYSSTIGSLSYNIIQTLPGPILWLNGKNGVCYGAYFYNGSYNLFTNNQLINQSDSIINWKTMTYSPATQNVYYAGNNCINSFNIVTGNNRTFFNVNDEIMVLDCTVINGDEFLIYMFDTSENNLQILNGKSEANLATIVSDSFINTASIYPFLVYIWGDSIEILLISPALTIPNKVYGIFNPTTSLVSVFQLISGILALDIYNSSGLFQDSIPISFGSYIVTSLTQVTSSTCLVLTYDSSTDTNSNYNVVWTGPQPGTTTPFGTVSTSPADGPTNSITNSYEKYNITYGYTFTNSQYNIYINNNTILTSQTQPSLYSMCITYNGLFCWAPDASGIIHIYDSSNGYLQGSIIHPIPISSMDSLYLPLNGRITSNYIIFIDSESNIFICKLDEITTLTPYLLYNSETASDLGFITSIQNTMLLFNISTQVDSYILPYNYLPPYPTMCALYDTSTNNILALELLNGYVNIFIYNTSGILQYTATLNESCQGNIISITQDNDTFYATDNLNIYALEWSGISTDNWGIINITNTIPINFPTNPEFLYSYWSPQYNTVDFVITADLNNIYSCVINGTCNSINTNYDSSNANVIWMNGQNDYIFGYTQTIDGSFNIFAGPLTNIQNIQLCANEPWSNSMCCINNVFFYINPDDPEGNINGYDFTTLSQIFKEFGCSQTLSVDSFMYNNTPYVVGLDIHGCMYNYDMSGSKTYITYLDMSYNVIEGPYPYVKAITSYQGIIYIDNIGAKIIPIASYATNMNSNILFPSRIFYNQEYTNIKPRTNKIILFVGIIGIIVIIIILVKLILN